MQYICSALIVLSVLCITILKPLCMPRPTKHRSSTRLFSQAIRSSKRTAKLFPKWCFIRWLIAYQSNMCAVSSFTASKNSMPSCCHGAGRKLWWRLSVLKQYSTNNMRRKITQYLNLRTWCMSKQFREITGDLGPKSDQFSPANYSAGTAGLPGRILYGKNYNYNYN